jgi:hypothetical protein
MNTMKAFVLLNTELGQESKIMEALEGVKEIIHIYSLYGIYDLILEMEAEKSTITLLTYGDPLINE